MRGEISCVRALSRALEGSRSAALDSHRLLHGHVSIGLRLSAANCYSTAWRKSLHTDSKLGRFPYIPTPNPRNSPSWIIPRPRSSRDSLDDLLGVQQRCYSSKLPDGNRTFGEMTEEQYGRSPDRFQLLGAKEIGRIFGPGITTKQGNDLLATIQKQRVTGTLDVDVNGPGVTKASVAKALNWLREEYHLDEDAAIVARIEREEQAITNWHPQQGMEKLEDLKDIYGKSEFETRIQQVKEIKALRQKEEMEERQAKEAERNTYKGPKDIAERRQAIVGQRRPGQSAEWVRKYRERAKLSNLEETPEIKPRQVLIGPTMFTVVAIAFCIWFGNEYTPPNLQQRFFPEIPAAAATVGGIIALNILVFAAWKTPPFWRFMNKYFLLIAATPNPVAMVGSVFSHQSLSHLAGNMLGLWFLGTQLCDDIGRGRFLALYLASGVFGSWVSLIRFIVTKNYGYTSLGASGAVLGVLAAYCSLYPNRYLTIAFLPEDWARYFAMRAEYVLYTGFLITALLVLRGRVNNVDHAAHLGGIIGGIAASELIRRQVKARRHLLARQRPLGFGK